MSYKLSDGVFDGAVPVGAGVAADYAYTRFARRYDHHAQMVNLQIRQVDKWSPYLQRLVQRKAAHPSVYAEWRRFRTGLAQPAQQMYRPAKALTSKDLTSPLLKSLARRLETLRLPPTVISRSSLLPSTASRNGLMLGILVAATVAQWLHMRPGRHGAPHTTPSTT